MKGVIVRYQVKADRASENQALIERVFEELKRSEPSGLRYASLKLSNGVSFVHIATTETSDGVNPLSRTTAFKAFLAGIKDRCVEPPVASDFEAVGSYRFFGG